MVFGRLLGKSTKMGGAPGSLDQTNALAHIERLESAIFRIGSVFAAHKDLNTILEYVVREAVNCLRANRSTFFYYDREKGTLKAQFTHALNPRYQQVDLIEEKEAAKKALKEKKPLLLAGPESFSDFFKKEKRENNITSLMSIPLFNKGEAVGVLSVLLINQRFNFQERNLGLFSGLANLVLAAMELADLNGVAREGKDFRITCERHLDNILGLLEGVSEREQQGTQNHISINHSGRKAEEPESKINEKVPWAQGAILLKPEPGIDRRKDERIEVRVRVEFEEELCCFTGDLSRGGAFILTQNPMDLEEEFSLKIHIPDGREPVEVGCKVIWTNKYGKESKGLRRGMGIKFLKL
jgi:hypothetical protein